MSGVVAERSKHRQSTKQNGLQRATSHSNDASTAQTPEKKAAQEPIIVMFDGPDNPLNPQDCPVRIPEQNSDPEYY